MRRKLFLSSLLCRFRTLAAAPTNVSGSRPHSTTLLSSRFGFHDSGLWCKHCSSVASKPRFFQDEKQGCFPSRYSEDAKKGRLVSVNAYFLSTSVDLKSLRAQNAFNLVSLASRVSDCVILRFYDDDFKFESDPQVFKFDFSNESNCHYVVVFQYGSVVLFNVSEQKADGYLKIVENHALTLLSERSKDDYSVVEIPTLKTWMKGGLDHIMLKSLSVDGIHTIASVLGQSIALDYFIRKVDVMVELFSNINQEMEKTGHFRLKNKMLLQLVGKANSILEAVILKLKLFDRPEIAWKNANYALIWEYLRDDFELTNRFGSLHFKLEFVERNIAFFRKILQDRKMYFLDSLIVTLLIVEIFMSIYRKGI